MLLAIGGGLQTVEVFSVLDGTWRVAAPLPVPLHIQVVELDGYIYAFGSAEPRSGKELRRASRYSPYDDSWEDLGELPSVLEDAWGSEQLRIRQVTTCAGAIYAAGDRHVARFQPPRRWDILPAMPGDEMRFYDIFNGESDPISRKGFKMVATGGLIYAVGGEARSQS